MDYRHKPRGWVNFQRRLTTETPEGPRGGLPAFSLLHFYSGAPMHFLSGVDTIKAKWTRLMQQNHPDRGGSNFFAKHLNEARAVLGF